MRVINTNRRMQGGKGGGERVEREEVEEGVGAGALRDTTPVVSTRLPKQPPFGNPRLPPVRSSQPVDRFFSRNRRPRN